MRPQEGPALPTGRVTMLFTDIEGSTRLLESIGNRYLELLETHRRVLRRVWRDHGGVEVSADADAFFVVFDDAQAAVDAAVTAQRTLKRHGWAGNIDLRVRMGMHTGRPEVIEHDRDYWGVDVHLAARVGAAAHGGQVLVTAETAEAVSAQFEDLGEWRLKDFERPIRLFQPVIDGEGADSFPPPRALDVRPSNLPLPTTQLVGREAEVAKLSQLLSGSARLVTIVGIGGVGKTRLALAVGHALLEHFRDGVFFADLSGLADPASVPQIVAEAIGIDAEVELGTAARHQLRDRRLLVIVDNCEHVLRGVAAIAGLLEAAPEVRILSTSQAPLRLRGEQCVALDSLGLPSPGSADVEALGAVASVRLFVERARAVDASFELSRENAASIVDICNRLEGIPMAIEIAAARCRVLSTNELARRLEADLFSLGGGNRDSPGRQRSLDAAMEWAIGLLEDEARVVFTRWGVFGGRPTLERAELICGPDVDVLKAVEALIDHSLLRRDPDRRLRMPQSVHAYARRLLERSGELGPMRRRHAEVMAGVAEGCHAAFMMDTEATLADVVAERDDLYSALRWAADADAMLHARLAGSMALPQVDSLSPATLAPHIDRALAFESGLSRTSARLRVADGVVAYVRGDRVRERARFEEAIAMMEFLGDDRECALTLTVFAKAVASGDQPGVDALDLLARARALASRAGGHEFEELVDSLAAEVHLSEGRVDEAERLFAGMMANGAARHFAAVQAPMYLPDLAFARGRYHEALEGHAQLLRAAQLGSVGQNAVWAVDNVGVCLIALHEFRRGLVLVGASAAMAEHLDMKGRPSQLTTHLREYVEVARDQFGAAETAAALEEGQRMDWNIAVGVALRAPGIVSPLSRSATTVDE